MEYVRSFLEEHWFTALSVVVYLIANVVPRPSPATHKLSRGEEIFWAIVDRLCFLTSKGMPGGLKMVLSASKAPECPATGATKPEGEAAPTLDGVNPPVGESVEAEASEPAPETLPAMQHEAQVEESPAADAPAEEAKEEPVTEPPASSEDGVELAPIPQPPVEKVIEQAPVRVRQSKAQASGSKKSSGKGKKK